MSNLLSSIVRGFGFTLGRKAATSLIDGISTRQRVISYEPQVVTPQEVIPEEVKLTWSQKILTLIIHLGIVFLLALGAKSTGGHWGFALFNFGYFLIGWIIPVNIFSKINEKKYLPIIQAQENEIREKLYAEIDILIEKLAGGPYPGWAAPMGPNNRYDGDWTEMKYKYPTSHLTVIKDTFNRMVNYINKNVTEYGVEKFKEITSGTEPTIGMTEKEFGVWRTEYDTLLCPFKDILKNPSYPTNVEESVSSDVVYKTLIYGTKRTGDYYKFKNGILESYTQRD
jgi:hypothetical protein